MPRLTTSSTLRIHADLLRSDGHLPAGNAGFTLRWAWPGLDGSPHHHAVEAVVTPEAIWLDGRRILLHRITDPAWRRRVYFKCPGCSTLRLTLYLLSGSWCCRDCHQLRYASQNEPRSLSKRAWNRAFRYGDVSFFKALQERP